MITTSLNRHSTFLHYVRYRPSTQSACLSLNLTFINSWLIMKIINVIILVAVYLFTHIKITFLHFVTTRFWLDKSLIIDANGVTPIPAPHKTAISYFIQFW